MLEFPVQEADPLLDPTPVVLKRDAFEICAVSIASQSSQIVKSIYPMLAVASTSRPTDNDVSNAGHWRSPLDGLPSAAIIDHAEITVSLTSFSRAVKLQVPLSDGRSNKLPNTKGISAVCVGPR